MKKQVLTKRRLTPKDLVPRAFFLTRGVGVHRDELTSFELALRQARISRFNLVKVSSIVPPNCSMIDMDEGLKLLKDGEIVFVVMSQNQTNEKNRLISASVGVAIPNETSQHGYLAEYHSFGEDETIAGEYSEKIAATMLATLRGYDVDCETALVKTDELWKIKGDKIFTTNITQTTVGVENGIWTTVVAAAVLIL